MRTQYLAGIAIAALAGGAVWTAYSVRTSDHCPQPSAASITALFAPCQAFETALGHPMTRDEAAQIGVPLPPGPASAPEQQPAQSPAQLVVEDFQIMGQEDATAGVAASKH